MDEAALLGLGGQADPQAQQRALQYFEQLKASENGWELCANALTTGVYANNDHVKFFCLQVVEFYLRERYGSAGAEDQQKMMSFLMGWLQAHCQNQGKDPTFINNKAAQLFCLTFVKDYPNRWPTFFIDLLNTAGQQGVPAVWIYMRVLMAIDTEVVDRDIAHSDPEYQRNTLLKDAMREHSVVQMVDSWYHIINTYQTSHPEMTCFALGVIGAYVAWIDINLIANDKFVPVLLKFMTMPLLRESTCDCILEIISKGMDPIAKTRLIESFTTVLNNTGCFNVTDDEEGDYMAKLAKLINGIGLQLIQSWQKLVKGKDVENANVSLEALENKIPLTLKFLANEDDDVSGAVTQVAHDYITTLKQLIPLSDARKQLVKDLLFVIIDKMKYDDGYNFEQEGEDEAMFEEYRKELKVIFNNLGALDATLLLGTVQDLCTQTFNNWNQGAKFQDVEVAVSLLYQLAEALPASHGQHFSGDPAKATSVQNTMRLMITSKVCCYQHQSVQLQYFETLVRYDKFFNIEPEHVAEVLTAFLDERGLRNPSSHVRSRTAYLFSRFVKSLNKQNLAPFLEDLLTRIHDLLILHSPDNGLKQYLSPDDQLFIYETAGILIVHSQFPPEKKQALMRQLLEPVLTKFEGLLTSMMSETDENRQLLYAECVSHAMAFASRTSKGFTASQTMKQCGCVEVYTDTLKIFLNALSAPLHRQLLHQGVRQFLHRMVVCLDAEVLPFIPAAMENLLEHADAKELHDFIPLINQVVTKFKKLIVPFLGSVFVPVVTRIFSVLWAPVDERDQVAATERRMLHRSYFSFLATLVNNEVAEVLSMQESSNLHQVLVTVIQGAVDIPDPQGQKVCYGILRKLVDLWAGKDGLNGFADYVYDSIVPACFLGPLKPTFDLNDAQTVLVLNECAMCLKTILNKRGDELIAFLQTKYLPTLNVAPELCQEFCQALKADPKVFKSYYKSFFMRAKT